nr:hypothetical protein [uncultured bacterium]
MSIGQACQRPIHSAEPPPLSVGQTYPATFPSYVFGGGALKAVQQQSVFLLFGKFWGRFPVLVARRKIGSWDQFFLEKESAIISRWHPANALIDSLQKIIVRILAAASADLPPFDVALAHTRNFLTY